MLLGALTSDLLQDTSDISIDADGFCSNFSGCIGFPQIDAGVGSVFPGGGHTPEGIFDDAGGAYTGAQVQEQYFGALVPAQEVRIALDARYQPSSSTKVSSQRRFMVMGLPHTGQRRTSSLEKRLTGI